MNRHSHILEKHWVYVHDDEILKTVRINRIFGIWQSIQMEIFRLYNYMYIHVQMSSLLLIQSCIENAVGWVNAHNYIHIIS